MKIDQSLIFTEEQVKSMSKDDLLAALSKIDTVTCIMVASPDYSSFIAKAKTLHTPENKGIAALTVSRNRIVNRLMYAFRVDERAQSVLSLAQLEESASNVIFPEQAEVAGEWEFEPHKASRLYRLASKKDNEDGLIRLVIEHRYDLKGQVRHVYCTRA